MQNAEAFSLKQSDSNQSEEITAETSTKTQNSAHTPDPSSLNTSGTINQSSFLSEQSGSSNSAAMQAEMNFTMNFTLQDIRPHNILDLLSFKSLAKLQAPNINITQASNDLKLMLDDTSIYKVLLKTLIQLAKGLFITSDEAETSKILNYQALWQYTKNLIPPEQSHMAYLSLNKSLGSLASHNLETSGQDEIVTDRKRVTEQVNQLIHMPYTTGNLIPPEQSHMAYPSLSISLGSLASHNLETSSQDEIVTDQTQVTKQVNQLIHKKTIQEHQQLYNLTIDTEPNIDNLQEFSITSLEKAESAPEMPETKEHSTFLKNCLKKLHKSAEKLFENDSEIINYFKNLDAQEQQRLINPSEANNVLSGYSNPSPLRQSSSLHNFNFSSPNYRSSSPAKFFLTGSNQSISPIQKLNRRTPLNQKLQAVQEEENCPSFSSSVQSNEPMQEKQSTLPQQSLFFTLLFMLAIITLAKTAIISLNLFFIIAAGVLFYYNLSDKPYLFLKPAPTPVNTTSFTSSYPATPNFTTPPQKSAHFSPLATNQPTHPYNKM